MGLLPSSGECTAQVCCRRETSSEECQHWVCDGDNIFIDDADEEALRTGGPSVAGPSRRSDSPHPLHVPMPVPQFGRLSSVEQLTLVPIEVLDENESGFCVVPAVDLTGED